MALHGDKNGQALELKISVWTVVKIVIVLALLWFLWEIRQIIALLLISLLLSALVGPMADWLEKKKIPRPIGVVIIYIGALSIVGIIIGLLIPPLVQQVRELASNFSSIWVRVISGFTFLKEQSYPDELSQSISKGLSELDNVLTGALRGAFFAVTGIFGGVASLIMVLVMTFYLSIQKDSLQKIFSHLLPSVYTQYIFELSSKVQKKIILWARGQMILCLSIALLAYIGLLIFRMDYALVLALFAGVTEFIPYAGPLLGGTVAVFFALTQSPIKAFFVAVLFVVIQQFENHILVPKVMQRAVGINPLISILALLVGAKLGGITGAIFAIPAVTALDVISRDLLGSKEEKA